MYKIILTGSGGMLGQEILKQLQQFSKYEVFALSSQKERLEKKYADIKNFYICESHLQSIPDYFDLRDSILINCAFPRSSEGRELSNALDYTIDLLKEAKKIGCNKVINISSQSVYSQHGEKIHSEIDEVGPETLYGMTKLCVEKIVTELCSEYGLQFSNLRLGSLAGVQFEQRMINRFFTLIKNGKSLKIDQGDTKISYLFLEDAADCIIKFTELFFKNSKVSIKPVYNLGNNDWLSIRELAEKCNEQALKVGLTPKQIVEKSVISNYNNVINSDCIYKTLLWYPQHDMEKIIQNIFMESVNSKE